MGGFLGLTELDALSTGTITTVDLANGALSADVAGRAKIADDFFAADAASRAKFADDLWNNDAIAKFADGLFAADAASRAKFVDTIFENAKLATPAGRVIIPVPIHDLNDLTAGIAGAQDVVTDILPGFAGTIEGIFYIAGTVGAGAGATIAFHVEIGAVAVTGGVVTVTLANATPLGNYVAGTAVTALNVFADTDVLSLCAAAGTAFASGAGVFVIVCGVAGQ